MSVTAPQGFVAAGLACGLKPSGNPDLAVVRSTAPATGAAMFTTHRVASPAVTVSKAHLAETEPQAVVVNSGNANAFTGERGHLDAIATASETARLLDLAVEQVLVCSTGIVGVPLPVSTIREGLPHVVAALSEDGGEAAAEAIRTTDTRAKRAVAVREGFAVGGMAKGSGMIHPALATMLAVVTTDYPLEPGEAIDFLRPAVERSFNRISVDGECSTNDTVILLANGASGAARDDAAFAEALGEVCASLARQIVEDAEGVTVIMEIGVSGAADDAQAAAIARRIATSPLVKTAAFGHDPNWGRILVAAGSAPYNGGFADLAGDRATLRLNGTTVFAAGAPVAAAPVVEGPALAIELEVGLGDGRASYLASDLSYDYVRINAEYTT